jgi:hypothetical protein
VEKLLKFDRSVAERFYALHREQLNPVPGDKLMGETRERTGTKLGSIRATFGAGTKLFFSVDSCAARPDHDRE